MAVKTEGKHTAEFLVSEANGHRSREQVTLEVPANTSYSAGTVLGIVSADGHYAIYDNDESDGTEAAAGVLYAGVENDTDSAVEIEATAIVRDAEVHSASLVWGDSNDATAGKTDLAGKGIIVRS